MYFQLLIFLLALIGLGIYKETGTPLQQKNARKKYIIFMMVLLILQSGLRNLAVGGDTYQYYHIFKFASDSSWQQLFMYASLPGSKDPGFPILCKAFSTIFPNYRLFLIAVAVFFFSVLGRVLYDNLQSNLDVLVSISLYECLYYGFFSITGIRQTLATAILLLALLIILKRGYSTKNTLSFFALFLLACTLHKSAFLFLPFYFLPLLRNNRIVFLFAFVLFVPMFSAGSYLGGFLEDTTFEKYAHYMQQSKTTGAIVFTLYIVLLALAIFIKLKSINAYSNCYHVYTSAIAIALLLSPLLVLDPNNQRIVQYFSIYGLIILPQLCRAYSRWISQRVLCISIFAVLAAYTLLRHEPYAFFWQDMVFELSGEIVNDRIIQ